ncbi:MAG: NUDIX hydrolase [Gammaproteobacteria bacterium]
MNFCSECGRPVELKIPDGDHLPRYVCTACQRIHYQNPRVVVGCVPRWKDRILLCRRAIEPRSGYWTLPAGFMENGESIAETATRETYEEAVADVEIGRLFAAISVIHVNQVHLMFLATLRDGQYGVGAESTETRLFAESEIPWSEIAFPSVEFTLRRYFDDSMAASVHVTEIVRRPSG